MHARFACPHCHASLDPASMDRAFSALAEYRICPECDEPVFVAVRAAPRIPAWLRREGAVGPHRTPAAAARCAASS